jgi:putative transposase
LTIRDGKGELFGNVDLQRCYAAHLKAHTNSYAERWIRSIKEECLSKLILFGEGSLRCAVTEFIEHFHAERNHQGKGNVLLFPAAKIGQHRPQSRVRCRERLGGLLKYYTHVA